MAIKIIYRRGGPKSKANAKKPVVKKPVQTKKKK